MSGSFICRTSMLYPVCSKLMQHISWIVSSISSQPGCAAMVVIPLMHGCAGTLCVALVLLSAKYAAGQGLTGTLRLHASFHTGCLSAALSRCIY